MNRIELVDAVGERLGDRRAGRAAVEAVLDTVTAALSGGDKVSLSGFGVFERVDRAPRTARNPATGGTVEVPATAVPRFRPGQGLRDAVNGRTSGAAQRRATLAGPPAQRARADARDRTEDVEARSDTAGSTAAGSEAGSPTTRSSGADGGELRRKADGRTAGKEADGKKADGRTADSGTADAGKAGRKAGGSKVTGKGAGAG